MTAKQFQQQKQNVFKQKQEEGVDVDSMVTNNTDYLWCNTLRATNLLARMFCCLWEEADCQPVA